MPRKFVAAVAALREALDISTGEAKRGAIKPYGGVKGAAGASSAVLAMAVVRWAKRAAVFVYDVSAETSTPDRHAFSLFAASKPAASLNAAQRPQTPARASALTERLGSLRT